MKVIDSTKAPPRPTTSHNTGYSREKDIQEDRDRQGGTQRYIERHKETKRQLETETK